MNSGGVDFGGRNKSGSDILISQIVAVVEQTFPHVPHTLFNGFLVIISMPAMDLESRSTLSHDAMSMEAAIVGTDHPNLETMGI